jgi:hypothetical protein
VLGTRRKDRLDDLARATEALAVSCDLSLPADRRKAVETAVNAVRRLDVLVDNAGVTKVQPALEESHEFVSRASTSSL